MKAGINKNFLNGETLHQKFQKWLRQSRIKARIFYHFLAEFQMVIFFCQSVNFIKSESPNQFNFFKAYGPGIYQIYCKVNQKRYIGESQNILRRLGQHVRDLEKGVSHCSSLQKDWTKYSANQFEATILYFGADWQKHEVRLKKENELILNSSPDKLYNFHPLKMKTNNENYRIICEINGIQYDSIAQASKLTGESQTRIRIKLQNNYENYKIIDQIKNGYEPIIINGKLYSSILSAVEAGEAKDRFQAMKRLKSLKYSNWNYQSANKFIDKSPKKP